MNSVAIVFPGQGSQTVGMLADIAAQFVEVKQAFAEASDVLGYDLWQLVQHGSAAELDQTIHTQPAILTASYAIWRIIQPRQAILPVVFAGHSLGEYTALVCASALSFADAITLVAARGKYMQEAVFEGVGAMAAIIGLDETTVMQICQQAIQTEEEVLAPANFNSPGQIVIAGHRAPVNRAIQLAKAQGAKLAVLIPVSVPSHCGLMKPAAKRLATRLASIHLELPQTPVLNNVDMQPYTNIEMIRAQLAKQLTLPVQWVATIRAFVNRGVDSIIECGPGKVLTGLNKRIDKTLHCVTTSDLASLQTLLKK